MNAAVDIAASAAHSHTTWSEVVMMLGRLQPGSLPTWGMLVTLLGWAVKTHFDNRKLRMAENKDDRDGYGALITTLQNAVTSMEAKHTADIMALRVEHSAQLERIAGEHRRCEERLAKIEGELMGFHRQALVQSQQSAAALPASGQVLAAGERAIEASLRAIHEADET